MSSLDPSLNQFLQQMQGEVQRMKMAEQVNTLASRCWDICLSDSRPPSKMDSKTKNCLENCVNRLVDASNFMAEHLQKLGSQTSSMGNF